MKRTLLISAVLLGLILVAVGYRDDAFKTAIGTEAPAFRITEGDSTVTLADYQGKYLLLNFWTSTDARSRRDVNKYVAWKRGSDKDLDILCINLDDNPVLYNEIVRNDSLMPELQYRPEGIERKQIIDAYGLDKGNGSVLIGPDGKVICHNPTAKVLSRLTPERPTPGLHRNI